MAIRIVRLGTPREKDEGLRIGTVRRPPRGVPKSEFARRDFYDVWYPVLSPTQELVTEALHAESDKDWRAFVKKFKAEMAESDASKTLDLLAALSHQTNMSVGFARNLRIFFARGLRPCKNTRYNFASVGALAQLVEQRTLNP